MKAQPNTMATSVGRMAGEVNAMVSRVRVAKQIAECQREVEQKVSDAVAAGLYKGASVSGDLIISHGIGTGQVTFHTPGKDAAGNFVVERTSTERQIVVKITSSWLVKFDACDFYRQKQILARMQEDIKLALSDYDQARAAGSPEEPDTLVYDQVY